LSLPTRPSETIQPATIARPDRWHSVRSRGPPAPYQNDPRNVRDPQADQGDRLAVEQMRANFAAAARLRGEAIGQLISDRLRNAPLAMLQELLDTPADQVPIFAPVIGPAIVARRQYVLTCLTRDYLFTVDPYAAKMARGMDDPARASGAFSHFLLGTEPFPLAVSGRG
jgi:hypothetical protein